MKQLKPYIMFTGQCKEALTFYKDCLEGKITTLQTFADSPVDVPEGFKQRIFNSEFQAENIFFMASDSIPQYEINTGNNFALFVTFSDSSEQEKVFNKLLEGGRIIMPLENNFGMLVDKFGIQWMLDYSDEQK